MENIEAGMFARGRRPVPGPRRPHQRPAQHAPGTRVVNAFPYYSAIRYQAAITNDAGSPPTYTYTIAAAQERRAFGYAIGDSLAAAGFDSTWSATSLETNLLQRSQTNAGERVLIEGISAYLTADSDPLLAALLFERLAVSISLNGDTQQFRLGRAAFLPGGGGLHGAGHTALLRPGQQDQSRIFSVANNGLPGRENFYALPYPIKWSSAGKADSNLVVLARTERAVVQSVTSRASATGVEPWTPPTAVGQLGSYVDIVFKFHTRTEAERSANA
tara:strand:+ start:208 stop:1029 length:822 start_codon:yes stop_codon:yes gene_type:complete